MQGMLDSFVAASTVLTGFSRIELYGTGVAAEYLAAVQQAVPDGTLRDLLSAFNDLVNGVGQDDAVQKGILSDAQLGPVAKHVTMMWYTGSWTALPQQWHVNYGANMQDATRVVSAEAYQAGLQWIAAGAHAPGSSPQGFGDWAMAPERSIA